MTKPHQEEHKHKRFYVFRHTSGQDIQYVDEAQAWNADFYKAMLWSDEDRAVGVSLRCKADNKESGVNFVVGCVKVEVDGFYVMRVAQ